MEEDSEQRIHRTTLEGEGQGGTAKNSLEGILYHLRFAGLLLHLLPDWRRATNEDSERR